LLKACSSVVELRKGSGGRHRGAEETIVGDPPSPVILALLFMMMTMTMEVQQDWSNLLRAAYNRKSAASWS